jgi:hypothetical protein
MAARPGVVPQYEQCPEKPGDAAHENKHDRKQESEGSIHGMGLAEGCDRIILRAVATLQLLSQELFGL